MNPEQQRIAIAEACGWTVQQDSEGFWRAVDASGRMSFSRWISQENVWSVGFPDYVNDLNAMHEAEKILAEANREEYLDILYGVCNPHSILNDAWNLNCATASQRAEAFLRTIGKWKEVK